MLVLVRWVGGFQWYGSTKANISISLARAQWRANVIEAECERRTAGQANGMMVG